MTITEKPLVLLVDDNEATLTLVTALLQREFTIETAADGVEAMDKLRTRQYACVLLDLRMPPPDGHAILEFLQTTRPDLLKHVLVVTAALTPREMERVRTYDVCGIIPKPFEVEGLLNAVRECAGCDGGTALTGGFISSGMILLLGELLRGRLL